MVVHDGTVWHVRRAELSTSLARLGTYESRLDAKADVDTAMHALQLADDAAQRLDTLQVRPAMSIDRHTDMRRETVKLSQAHLAVACVPCCIAIWLRPC